jgi:hypothetical protein
MTEGAYESEVSGKHKKQVQRVFLQLLAFVVYSQSVRKNPSSRSSYLTHHPPRKQPSPSHTRPTMAPSQDDIKSSIQSSNLTVSECDINASSTTKEESSNNSSQGHKSLKDLAKRNPTQLGDPVSLKAETSDHEPTDQDRGAKGKGGDLAGAPNRDSKL